MSTHHTITTTFRCDAFDDATDAANGVLARLCAPNGSVLSIADLAVERDETMCGGWVGTVTADILLGGDDT